MYNPNDKIMNRTFNLPIMRQIDEAQSRSMIFPDEDYDDPDDHYDARDDEDSFSVFDEDYDNIEWFERNRDDFDW